MKTRIKKLAAVEVSSGLLNDLTKEEKKKFMKIETSREIKRLRKELDLTQKQLAELIGVTSRSVSRWESGDSEPSPVVQKSIRRWIHLLDELKDTFEEEALREWFHRPNDSLDGKTPFEVACEIGGENRLRNLLERTEWGIPG